MEQNKDLLNGPLFNLEPIEESQKQIPKTDKVTQTLDSWGNKITTKNLLNFFKILIVGIGIILIFKIVLKMF